MERFHFPPGQGTFRETGVQFCDVFVFLLQQHVTGDELPPILFSEYFSRPTPNCSTYIRYGPGVLVVCTRGIGL